MRKRDEVVTLEYRTNEVVIQKNDSLNGRKYGKDRVERGDIKLSGEATETNSKTKDDTLVLTTFVYGPLCEKTISIFEFGQLLRAF